MSSNMSLNSMAMGLDISDTKGTLTLKRNDSPAGIVFPSELIYQGKA